MDDSTSKFIKKILLQMALGVVIKQGWELASTAWETKVRGWKSTKGLTFLDEAKDRLYLLLKDYVAFRNNSFNLFDVKAAAQLNKIPMPELQLAELFLVCEFITKHESTGFGYVGVPKFMRKKTEEVVSFLEALERQRAASLSQPRERA